LKEIVFDRLRYALERKELSIEQKHGVLTLIPKKDANLKQLKNW
jgi:hypothetical protein